MLFGHLYLYNNEGLFNGWPISLVPEEGFRRELTIQIHFGNNLLGRLKEDATKIDNRVIN